MATGVAQAQQGGAVLIKNATVMTVTKGNIAGGSVLIENGKITAVGKDLKAPAGATVIDATGMFVTPGIIDAHSHIAAGGGVNEGSLSVTSMVGIEDVISPDDINIYRDMAAGVTTVNVLHGSANSIGGKNAVLKLRWGKDANGLKFAGAMPGIKFALGENVKRSTFNAVAGVQRRYPISRMGVDDVIREAFTDAREYKKAWDMYNKAKAAGTADLIPPRRDLKLEPLVEIMEGKRLVHCHSYRSDEIVNMIRIADDFGFKIATFQHVLEGYKVAKELAAHGAGASTFSDWWAYKLEAYDAIPYNAALMTRKGVLVSINSDSAEEARHLNQEAAKTMKFGGLTEQEALALVTINPAKQLRIDSRVGSIEVGKDADLVIFNKHPLSVYTVAQKVFIDGQMYFDIEKDKQMRAAVEKEKKDLVEKERRAAEAARPPGQRPGSQGQRPPAQGQRPPAQGQRPPQIGSEKDGGAR
jgi:imidazolonepropionase-like amidohydrolase